MDRHFTRCLMQIRSDTCECHLYNGRPFTISFQVCTHVTRRRDGRVVSPPRERRTDAGEPKKMDVIFGPDPYFSRPTRNCPFLVENACDADADAVRPPPAPAHPRGPRPSPLIKSPDSVKKILYGERRREGGRGRFGAVFQSAYIRRFR